MNMMTWLWWTWILCAGFGIGVFFFGGLWLTVNQLEKMQHPGGLFMVSFFTRTLVSVFGFYLLTDQQIANALIAMVGFLLARFVIVRVQDDLPQNARKDVAYATES